MKNIVALSLLIFLLVRAAPGAAQNHPHGYEIMSGRYDNARFADFARDLAAQTRHRLYYDSASVAGVRVTAVVDKQPVDAVLRTVLANTDLHFAVDADRRIFITTGAPIQTELPAGFFVRTPGLAQVGQASVPDDASATGDEAVGRPVNKSTQRLYEIGLGGKATNDKANIAGHIRDLKTGEVVIGISIVSENPLVGTTTDQFGYYYLELPTGRHELTVKGIGIKTTRRQIVLYGDGKLDIEVADDITVLRGVVIEANKDLNVAGLQMGLEKLDIKTIRQVPTALGETDILRVMMTLPGVKSIGEGSTGMSVRGGATDQNLLLFNDATLYNPTHLFGFFSAFNPDIIKSVELYKSGLPARYGGRISSVLDIATRDGNTKKFAGAGGIGLLTSRLMLEGPIISNRTSFIVAGRSSYSNWLLHKVPNRAYQQSDASFYDLNAHITHKIDDRNTLYLTGYVSHDRFRLAADTVYKYLNQTATLKWNHNFNNQLYGVFTGSFTRYKYDISSEANEVNASALSYQIRQGSMKADFSYFYNNRHTVDFGASSIFYAINPGSLLPLGSTSLIKPDVLSREQALESAVYVSDKFDLSPRLQFSAGLRYSLYNALGPKDAYQYEPNVAKSLGTITDTLTYGPGQVAATYHGPEFRLALRYALTANSSVKTSYNRTRQYIHMLSNTASVSPTDIWKLSDGNIRPQVGDQISLGYYHNFKNNTIETSIETYYKKINDFVDYKSGATLVLNHHIETDIVNAEGRAYGVEFMVKKLTGKMNGWVSYTYSRSLVHVNSGTTSEAINGGLYYPSNFDKPHDFTLISNYRFSRRFSTSFNFTYNTGRPITLPIARYYVGSSMRVLYSDRNAYRVPDYYRADFAMNIEGNHKVKKLAHSSWSLSVYNLTGRKNPYSIYYKSVNGQIRGYKLSIFAQPIPSITYNFKF